MSNEHNEHNEHDGQTFVVGLKQTVRYLENHCIKEVFLAQDADFYVIRQVEELAQNQGIKITRIESMKKLGKQCGIDVGAATAGIIKTDCK